jgi:hypothetical protein
MLVLIYNHEKARNQLMKINMAGKWFTQERFWDPLIDKYGLTRTIAVLISRYEKVLNMVHVKEYDFYIELLAKKFYRCVVRYGKHHSS